MHRASSVLQRVAACCSMLQCAAPCCSVLGCIMLVMVLAQHPVTPCNTLPCNATCRHTLQLNIGSAYLESRSCYQLLLCFTRTYLYITLLGYIVQMRCLHNTQQHTSARCNTLQHTATHYNNKKSIHVHRQKFQEMCPFWLFPGCFPGVVFHARTVCE